MCAAPTPPADADAGRSRPMSPTIDAAGSRRRGQRQRLRRHRSRAPARRSGSDEIEMDPNTAEDLDPEKGSAATRRGRGRRRAESPERCRRGQGPRAAADGAARHDRPRRRPADQGRQARDCARRACARSTKKQPAQRLHPVPHRQPLLRQALVVGRDGPLPGRHQEKPGLPQQPDPQPNIITMLSAAKTRQRATNFLRGVIGHPAGRTSVRGCSTRRIRSCASRRRAWPRLHPLGPGNPSDGVGLDSRGGSIRFRARFQNAQDP